MHKDTYTERWHVSRRLIISLFPFILGKDAPLAKTIAGRAKDAKIPEVPAPNAYNRDKSEDFLEGGIQLSFGLKPEIKNKFQTPSPNAYNAEKGEEYLEERPAKSMGARLEPKTKYKTPAPNAYDADKGQEYLEESPAKSMGAKLDDMKKYNTPAPNA